MSGCTVSCRAEGARTVISLDGDLVLTGVQDVEHEIRAGRRAHGEHLVFDLAPLAFLDSSGLSLLLRFYLAAEGRGGSAALAGPICERVARVLQVTNLDQRLTIHPSLRAALDVPPPAPSAAADARAAPPVAGHRPGARDGDR